MLASRNTLQNPPGHGVFITVNELFYEGLKAQEFTLKKRARLLEGGGRSSVLRGRGMEFFESRPYVMQDEKRSIDWKVSARRQGLYTKIFIEEKDRPIFLVVDLRKSMFFGSVNCFKSVLAARLAARLASAAKNGGDRVGGFIESAEEIYCPVGSSQKTLAELFAAIAKASRAYVEKKAISRPTSSWPELLARIANRAPKGAQILILSDFFDLDNDVRPALTRLRKKADIFAIKIFDPLEENLPSLGSVGMAYNGLHVRFDSSDKALQKNYLATFLKRQQKLQGLFSSLNIPLMSFSTALSPDLGLRRVFSGQW